MFGFNSVVLSDLVRLLGPLCYYHCAQYIDWFCSVLLLEIRKNL